MTDKPSERDYEMAGATREKILDALNSEPGFAKPAAISVDLIAESIAQARREGLQEIANEMGLEFEDERVRYVNIQIPRDLWLKLRALAEEV
jgi:hypothetical protein